MHRRPPAHLLIILAALLLSAGCATRPAPGGATLPTPDRDTAGAPMPGVAIPPVVEPRPLPQAAIPAAAAKAARPAVQTGVASWYGKPFHGRRTASGEIFDMHAMTAAHRTLPLPSWARVRNPANGREIIVRINDRGPYKRGRIIDLSRAAARRLGIGGIATVQVEPLTAADAKRLVTVADAATHKP